MIYADKIIKQIDGDLIIGEYVVKSPDYYSKMISHLYKNGSKIFELDNDTLYLDGKIINNVTLRFINFHSNTALFCIHTGRLPVDIIKQIKNTQINHNCFALKF